MSINQQIIDKSIEYYRETLKGWKDPDVPEAYIQGYLEGLRFARESIVGQSPRQNSTVIFRNALDAMQVAICGRCGSIRHHVSDCEEGS